MTTTTINTREQALAAAKKLSTEWGRDPDTAGGMVGTYDSAATAAKVAAELRAAGCEVSESKDSEGWYVWVVVADKITTTINYGNLCDSTTGETIRPATCGERNDSLLAGAEGIILVDGRACYVEGDNVTNRPDEYHTGYEACVQGEDESDCPYAKGTWEYSMWRVGYRDAE